MNKPLCNATVEILGKVYSIRCPEEELPFLEKAAEYLNAKMQEVKESGKAINLERIAIMAALNITYDLLQKNQGEQKFIEKVNQKIVQIQEKIENSFSSKEEVELVYSNE